jgi:vitamin B12 transporter
MDETAGRLLPRRAMHQAGMNLAYENGHWGTTAQWQASSERFEYDDFSATTHRLSGYGLLHLQAFTRLNPAWLVQLQLENALNRSYYLARSYPQPPRTWWLALRYSPTTAWPWLENTP